MKFGPEDAQWLSMESTNSEASFSMPCPYCATHAHFGRHQTLSYLAPTGTWTLKLFACASCRKPVILLSIARTDEGSFRTREVRLIEPATTFRPPPSEHVPETWRKDYVEASVIQAMSPKSSAALLRRILDGMLREKTSPATVHAMIEALKGVLPDYVWSGLHDLREFGNLSAHPTWNNVGQIVDVEPNEVEMCFEVIDEMFEHWYEAPQREQQRKDKLAARKAEGMNKKP
jgi:hypothetical protein